MVERYVLVGTQRVPFVLLGPGGVFTLCATDGAWTLYDLEVLSRLGDELRDRLPGYRGRVEAVVCLAFDHAEPRAWYGGADRGGRGGWVLGVDQLLPWLYGWGPEHGLAPTTFPDRGRGGTALAAAVDGAPSGQRERGLMRRGRARVSRCGPIGPKSPNRGAKFWRRRLSAVDAEWRTPSTGRRGAGMSRPDRLRRRRVLPRGGVASGRIAAGS